MTDVLGELRSAGSFDRVVQTHISMLFFTGDRVYKVKKPVKLDFLDYSTLELRRHFCAEEVRLNRRLAPDVYLGVAPITREPDGTLQVGGTGNVVEYAVEMVRLPDDRMMSAVLDRGELDNGRIDVIVDLLRDFHRDAATGPGVDEYGRTAEIATQVEEVFRELEPFPDVTADLREHLRGYALAWLDRHADLLDRRVREGRVREGHGDLHAGNICLTDDGVVIYDCIEFSARYRCRDVACELAFLAMDLDLRCYRGFSGYLLHRYAELTDDPDLPAVAAFFKGHLAVVRGRVACMRAETRIEALRYLHLAAAYTLEPVMVLMCGLPATGKSHTARAIAQPFEAAVLRSDVVRKELAGLGAAERDSAIYTPEFTQRVYATLFERAVDQLRRGRTVVADAMFPTAALRAPFLDAARDLGVRCVLVETTCPPEEVRRRMEQRVHLPDEPSDADWAVYREARERFEPPDEVQCRVRVETRGEPEAIVAAVLARLIS